MSIFLLTGVPGSGKSYYAVTELKKRLKDFVIISNIDGLRFDVLSELGTIYNLDDFLQDRSAQKFFSNSFQEKFTKQIQDKHGKPVCYFIDEFHVAVISSCVRLPPDLLHFFAYHRHYGMDVFIITQNVSLIHRQLCDLAAYEIRSKKGVVVDFFLYQLRLQGETFKTLRLPKDKLIFALYQSFQRASGKTNNSKLLYVAIVFIVCTLGSSIYLIGCRGVMGQKHKISSSLPPELKPIHQPKSKSLSKVKPEPILESEPILLYFSSYYIFNNKLKINTDSGQFVFDYYGKLNQNTSRFKIDDFLFIRGVDPEQEKKEDNKSDYLQKKKPSP